MGQIRFRDPAGSVRTGTLNRSMISSSGTTYEIENVAVLPPSEPSKIVCVGLNYADHAAEAGMDIPDRPMLFLKPPNTLSSHGSTVSIPGDKDRIDYEAELGIVIDQQCRNVSANDAMSVVAGFTCVNDISNRDDQEVEQNWVRGKAFDNSCPIGPEIAPMDAVSDDATIKLRLNGEIQQSSSISEFIFTIPELIVEISAYLTLEAGDVISTGTPAGVGPLSDGDTVAIEIDGIAPLEHDVTTS